MTIRPPLERYVCWNSLLSALFSSIVVAKLTPIAGESLRKIGEDLEELVYLALGVYTAEVPFVENPSAPGYDVHHLRIRCLGVSIRPRSILSPDRLVLRLDSGNLWSVQARQMGPTKVRAVPPESERGQSSVLRHLAVECPDCFSNRSPYLICGLRPVQTR